MSCGTLVPHQFAVEGQILLESLKPVISSQTLLALAVNSSAVIGL